MQLFYEIEKPSADTTSGTESVKTSKKRNKINTKDGTSSGKKMKGNQENQ